MCFFYSYRERGAAMVSVCTYIILKWFCLCCETHTACTLLLFEEVFWFKVQKHSSRMVLILDTYKFCCFESVGIVYMIYLIFNFSGLEIDKLWK